MRADYEEFISVAREVLDPDQRTALEAALAEPEPTEYVPDGEGNIVERKRTPEWVLISRRLNVLEQLARRDLTIRLDEDVDRD